MGFRFRRTLNLGPFRWTTTANGSGFSFGIPGFRIGKGADGRSRITLSIPGTGFSWQTIARRATTTQNQLPAVTALSPPIVAATPQGSSPASKTQPPLKPNKIPWWRQKGLGGKG